MEKVYVRTEDGYRTIIKIRDHTIVSDESIEDGGNNEGPMPPELLLGAAGACMAMTAKIYAKRKGWPLEGVEIELEMQRFDGPNYPNFDGDDQYVHEIREKMALHGPLDEAQKSRIMKIAGKCPVRRILKHPTFFIEELVDQVIAAEESVAGID